jgi:hypothetical protein
MSDFEKLINIARGQEEDRRDEVDGNIVPPRSDPNPELLASERVREQDPRYLAEKERLSTIDMDKKKSPFQHPCQNEKNTVTLVSIDKNHEIDIEFNRHNMTAMINLIRVEPSMRGSFVELLHAVHAYLKEERIEKVYQNIVFSDWEMVISKFKEFTLVKVIENNISQFPFAIVEMDAKDLVVGISKALGMNIDSHLDPEDLDTV